jgi:FtsP/CotA-like multicopper oxidase with cupredoxin domain
MSGTPIARLIPYLHVYLYEHPMTRFVPILLIFLLHALGAGAVGQASLAPPGWADDVRLKEAHDINPDPRIVEINLNAKVARVEISAGVTVEAWTYDGGLPGPLIRTRVGDRLIVHFSNSLPQPTTVHWHGLRVPIQMDGVPGASQPEVQTGGTFTYDFTIPDAGLYWYHPHVMSAAQVGFGLYGALIVDDPAEQIGVADEVVLVLSDIAADAKGRLEPPDSGGQAGMVFGREGNHVLVNGRTDRRLVARSGAPQRWRIVNAAKSRYFYLDLEGQSFRQIGGDGGLMEHPVDSDAVLVATGERVDLLVAPRGAPGSELMLRSLLYNRGYGSVEYREMPDLLRVGIASLPAAPAAPLPSPRRTIERLSTDGATEVRLDLTLNGSPSGIGAEWRINGFPAWRAKPLLAKPGETQIWTLSNKSDWSHPFHLHGFFFQAIDEKGEPVRPLVWKDTIDVPLKDTRRFIVKFDDREGDWMFHCHILDHADGGLMGTLRLGTPPTSAVHQPHRPPR